MVPRAGVVVSGNHVEVAYNRILNAKAPNCDYGTDGGAVELHSLGTLTGARAHDNWTKGCQGFMEAGGVKGASITDVEAYRNVS